MPEPRRRGIRLRCALLAGLLLLCNSSPVRADTPFHTIGGNLSLGAADARLGISGHLAGSYRFNATPRVSVGGSFVWGGSIDGDYDYHAYAALLDVRLLQTKSRRSAVFGRLIGHQFDYAPDDRFDEADSGISYGAGMGLATRFGFGLGFEALWEYMRFGSHVSLVTVGVGVTYSF
jgi:hypothetical protein